MVDELTNYPLFKTIADETTASLKQLGIIQYSLELLKKNSDSMLTSSKYYHLVVLVQTVQKKAELPVCRVDSEYHPLQ